MRPKKWIHPEDDKHVRDGDFRIVRLANGTMRATIWTQHRDSPYGYYADSQGEGVGDRHNEVVAVRVTWERRAS